MREFLAFLIALVQYVIIVSIGYILVALVYHGVVTGWYPGCGRSFWTNKPE